MADEARKTLFLRAGTAFDRHNLAMAFSALEIGDPYSVVLTYDARLSQPWGRVDMERDVYSIVPDVERADPVFYYALSNVGDVYHVGPNGATREHIPGAGMKGDGAAIGPVYRLVWAGGRLHALGGDNLIFRRDEDGWRNISPDIARPEGKEAPSWSMVLELAPDRTLLVGSIRATHPGLTRSLDWARNGMPKMSAEEFLATINADRTRHYAESPLDPLGLLLVRDEDDIRPVPLPQKGGLNAALRARDGTIWLTGKNGQILHGGDGLDFVALAADPQRSFGAMAETGDGIVVMSDKGLWVISEGTLRPFGPELAPGQRGEMLSPVEMASIPEGVVVFDSHHRVYLWDGDVWTSLEVPGHLLAAV